MRDAKKEADERLKYLRKQKQIVEGENERLRAQLTGGRPTNAISIETAQRQSDKGIKVSLFYRLGHRNFFFRKFKKKTSICLLRDSDFFKISVISQLTLQLEIAQESQIEAEETAERLRLELEQLGSKNERLKSELNEIGQMATVLEQERQTAVAKAANQNTLVEKETLLRRIRELEEDLSENSQKLGHEIALKHEAELKLAQLRPPEDILTLRKERDFYQEAYRKISQTQPGIDDEILSPEQVTNVIDERDAAKNKIVQLERKLAETTANLKVIMNKPSVSPKPKRCYCKLPVIRLLNKFLLGFTTGA